MPHEPSCPADPNVTSVDCGNLDTCQAIRHTDFDKNKTTSTYARKCVAAANCFPGRVSIVFESVTKCCRTDNCNGDFDSIVEAFQCYECAMKSSSDSCLTRKVCTGGNPMCLWTKTGGNNDTRYTYRCTTKEECATLQDATCCNTSLCNTGPTPTEAGTTLSTTPTDAGATVKVSIVAMLIALLVALWARN